MKRLIIVLLAVLAMLSGINAATAEDAVIADPPNIEPERASVECSPKLETDIVVGGNIRIAVDSYTNNTDRSVRLRLTSSLGLEKTWIIEPGKSLDRQVFSRNTPPIGNWVRVNLLQDGEEIRGTCSPPAVKVVPYFAKCRAVSKQWFKSQTNRTLIERMGKCLTQYFPRLTVAEVDHVATCESHWSQNSSSGKYKGVFQLGDAEFKAFSHQGPSWMHAEFSRNGWFSPENIFNARANILAALAHANRYGWSAWSCAP